MSELLRFLETYDVWIYLLLGLVGIFSFRRLVIAWQEWRNAIFGLERENSQRKLSASLTIVVLLALMATAEFIMVSFVAPVYPQTALIATPTLDLLATPTVTLAPQQTPESQNIAEGGLPTIAPASADGCVPGQLEWKAPADGEDVSGAVELKATVNLPNMGFFKYEFSQPGSSNWMTIAAGNKPVLDDVLGTWNTDQLTPGDYFLRLVVTDNQNQVLPACQIAVRVISQ